MRLDQPLADLFALSPSESTPILLELARRQAARRRPSQLLEQWRRDGFVQPSMLDLRLAHRLDALALDAAADFEAVLLSPVGPLGSCSVLAPTSQDRTLSAARGTEVVSDPTNMLALECASRLKSGATWVRLCTVHQVLRAQALPPQRGFSRHFRLFALAEAGPARPDDGFEVDAIARHVAVFDRLFDACEAAGYLMPERRATAFSDGARTVLAERIAARLTETLPRVELVRQPFESTYYAGVRVLFGARAASGDFIPLADTGAFDWMARLTANRRMRFVASGIGIQLIPLLFGTQG